MTYNYIKYFSFQLQIPFTAMQYRLFIDRINIMIHYNIFDLKKKIHIRMTLFRHFRFKGQTEKNC